MRLIESHNQEYELGLHSYELGMNHLGDMVNITFPIVIKYIKNTKRLAIDKNFYQTNIICLLIFSLVHTDLNGSLTLQLLTR